MYALVNGVEQTESTTYLTRASIMVGWSSSPFSLSHLYIVLLSSPSCLPPISLHSCYSLSPTELEIRVMSSNEQHRRRHRRRSQGGRDNEDRQERRPSDRRRRSRHRNYLPTPNASREQTADPSRRSDWEDRHQDRFRRNYSRTESQESRGHDNGRSNRSNRRERSRSHVGWAEEPERDREREERPRRRRHSHRSDGRTCRVREEEERRRDQEPTFPMGAALRGLWGLGRPEANRHSGSQYRPAQATSPYGAALINIYDGPGQGRVRRSIRRGPPAPTATGGAALTGLHQRRRRTVVTESDREDISPMRRGDGYYESEDHESEYEARAERDIHEDYETQREREEIDQPRVQRFSEETNPFEEGFRRPLLSESPESYDEESESDESDLYQSSVQGNHPRSDWQIARVLQEPSDERAAERPWLSTVLERTSAEGSSRYSYVRRYSDPRDAPED